MHWLVYLVAGFIGLLLLMQYLVWHRARQSIGLSVQGTDAVDGPAYTDRRKVYYFYATHCGPCRAMSPLVDRLRESHRNLIKVDIAASPELARQFGIAATPSFILVEDGSIRQVRLGTQSEAQLLNLVRGSGR